MIPCGLVWFGQEIGVGPDGMSAGHAGSVHLGDPTWIVSAGDSLHSFGPDMNLHTEGPNPPWGWTE